MFINKFLAKTATSLVVMAALVVFTGSPLLAQTDKVEVCQNGHTIEVDENGLKGVLNSGATLGPCETPSVPEFGALTGILAGVGSVGSYLLLKKRAASL